MTNFKTLFSISIFILILANSNITSANESNDVDYRTRLNGLDERIDKALSDFNLPGLAIAVVADGKVIKSSGYGLRDTQKGLPVTENTQFTIGSSTKAFTSFMIGTLVDEKKLGWDTPVKSLLPEWQTKEPYVTQNTTVRDLLSHRTGLSRHELIWLANPDLTAKGLLEKLPHLELGKQFREGFIYNNLAYAIAGILAEKVTGQEWEALVKTRILDKLRMDNTTLERTSMFNLNNFALPYTESDNQLELNGFNESLTDVMRPAGSINSSVKDMAKWLKMIVASGEFNQEQLINPNTLSAIQSPHTAISPFVGSKDNSPLHYALGWFTRSYRGHYQVQHGGNDIGFSSAMFTYPSQNIGIVVLTNKHASPVPHALSLEISDMLLNLEPRNHIEKSLNRRNTANSQQVKNADHKAKGNVDNLADYVGTYSHPGYGRLEIKEINGELELTYHNLKERFVFESKNSFNSVNSHHLGLFDGESLTFEQNKNGKITSVNTPFDFPNVINFVKDI